jgi:hypothetical protein
MGYRFRAGSWHRLAVVVTALGLLATVVAVGVVSAPAGADTAGFSATFVGSFPSPVPPLSGPRDMVLSPSGDVYVVDAGNVRVVEFGSDGTYKREWGGNAAGAQTPGKFENPKGITVDPQGYVYVTDSPANVNPRVQKFTSTGVFQKQWDISAAGSLTAAPVSSLYIAEYNSYRIEASDSDGGTVTTFWNSGNPSGVASDSSMFKLYVAEDDTGRIDRFEARGVGQDQRATPEAKWGGIGSGDGQFNHPSAIAVDGLGHVYVADSGNNRIQVFYPDGTYIGQWGTKGSATGQFDRPLGIAADASGHVYVSDTGNNRIQQFQVTLPADPPGCGSTISANVHLETDIGPCPANGIVVAGDNVTVDLGGHTILGRGVGHGLGVAGSGVTITNGTVQNFTVGLTIAPTLTVQGMRITQNSDVGVSVSGPPFYSPYPRPSANISDSSIDHNGDAFGVEFPATPSGSLASVNNSISSNASAGRFFGVEDYAGNNVTTFVGNKVFDNATGISFGGSLGSSSGAEIRNNDFRNNGGTALSTSGSCQNVVGNTFVGNAGAAIARGGNGWPSPDTCIFTDNTMSDNDYGININTFGLAAAQLERNTITSNRVAGIYIEGGAGPSGQITVTSNTVDNNGLTHPGNPVLDSAGTPVNDGIHIRNPSPLYTPRVIVGSNTTRGNADYGIEAFNVSNGGGNIAYNNGNPAQCLGVACLATPDLVVDSVSWTPPTPHAGDEVTFSAVIRNQGTGPTPAGVVHGVGFFIDGLNEVSWSDNLTSSLAPGQTITATANEGPLGKNTWTATPGTHTLTAWVDDVNRIAESNEQNNQLIATIAVQEQPPDTTTTSTTTTSSTLPPTTTSTTAPPTATTTAPPATPTTTTKPPLTTTTTQPVVLADTARSGYWMAGSIGSVYAFGAAANLGTAPVPPGTTATNMTATPSGNGYWIVTSKGTVYAFGDAPYLGATPTLNGGESVTSISTTRTGHGYWLFTNTGRVFTYGDATFYGDMSGTHLNGPVLGSVATPSGKGYYMVASDGGIFAFGDAAFHGSMGGKHLNGPVVGLAPDSDGSGYWLVASDGGIFAFDAPFKGSMGTTKLNKPVIGMVAYGDGYLMVATDGGIFSFSTKPFLGSLGANPPPNPIVAVTPLNT